MKKILLAAAIISIQFSICRAQNDPVIMEIGGQQIRQSEFMEEFLPTVGKKPGDAPTQCTYEKRQALNEYVELFANFRAKLLDAHNLGFDTTTGLRKELAKYRKELAAPYLIDSAVLDGLLHEAYERNHYSLHAMQIMVRMRDDAEPEDTLKAYQKIWEYYRRVTTGGEDFAEVAAEQVHKENPESTMQVGTAGDLGFFTAFDMVYPFENAAYGLEPGQISKPVRTRYGYHIVKLLEKVTLQGKLQVAHIWLRSSDSLSERDHIYSIYQSLQNGTPFSELAMQSNDRTTSKKGGEIPLLPLSKLPTDYVVQAQYLDEGEFSKPFFTQYGWHIIKVLHKDTLPTYRHMVPYYKQKMAIDPRGAESRKIFAANARLRYNIEDLVHTPMPAPVAKGTKGKSRKTVQEEQPLVMMASLDELVERLNDSVFFAKWRLRDTNFNDQRPIVRVPNREYRLVDLARHIRRNQKSGPRVKMNYYVAQHFNDFLDSVTIVYADSQLETENPGFADIVEEYRRGLIIFNYNDAMIWSKAITDTIGFAQFYAVESAKKSMADPADSLYFWKMRARVVVLDVADSSQLAPEKARKLMLKAQKRSLGSRDMKAMLESNFSKKAKENTPVAMSVEIVERTRQNLLTDNQWTCDVYIVPQEKGYRILVVDKVLEPMLKSQLEARGYYLNAYQNEVERRLNEELRRKYNVKINWNVVEEITY